MIGEELPKYIKKWLEANVYKFPNVVGYSQVWMPRERNKKLLKDNPVVRIYVSKKVPATVLKPQDIINVTIKTRSKEEKIETDVVEVGDVKALAVDKTKRFRPVELGVSIGNEAITAGSLGFLYEDTKGEILAGSNAHVLCDGDPSKPPSEIRLRNILQPGKYHNGTVPTDVVGQYVWHQQIYPLGKGSNCIISKAIADGLNFLAKGLGRKTRFQIVVESNNTVDFGLYKPTVEHILKTADDSINVHLPFIGHLFAGSETFGLICKFSEIKKIRPDIEPLNKNWCDVQVGDTVKGVSFWCSYQTTVYDTNATIRVNYGNWDALFQDVILVRNNGTIKGGWSGSGWFKTS